MFPSTLEYNLYDSYARSLLSEYTLCPVTRVRAVRYADRRKLFREMEDYEEVEIVSNGTVNGIQIAAHNSEVVSRYSRIERDPSLFSNEPASYLVSLLFDGK